MLSRYSNIFKSLFFILTMVVLSSGLTACDSEPPKLMKAVKQFKSDSFRDAHIKNMRINHMDELLHKRDDTMFKGIRTKQHSLKACINCHVPEQYNGKVLRSTDPEHFCATCHNYVAIKLDCFQCHVDHPNKQKVAIAPNDLIHSNAQINQPQQLKQVKKPSEKHLPTSLASSVVTEETSQ